MMLIECISHSGPCKDGDSEAGFNDVMSRLLIAVYPLVSSISEGLKMLWFPLLCGRQPGLFNPNSRRQTDGFSCNLYSASSRWKSLRHWPDTNETFWVFGYFHNGKIHVYMENMVLLFTRQFLIFQQQTDIHTELITSATQMTNFPMLDCRLEATNLANFGAKNEWAFLPKFLAWTEAMHCGIMYAGPWSADCMQLVFVNKTMCLDNFDRWVADEWTNWTYNRNMTYNRTDKGTGSGLEGSGPQQGGTKKFDAFACLICRPPRSQLMNAPLGNFNTVSIIYADLYLSIKIKNLAEKMGPCAIYILKRRLKKYDVKVVLEGCCRCRDSHDLSAYHHLYDLGRHI